MRRIICLLLCFLIIFVLTACNSTRNEQNSKSASPSESAENINTPAPMESKNNSPSDSPISGSKPTEVSERQSVPSAESAPVSTARPSASSAESAPAPATRPAVSPPTSSFAETGDKDMKDDNMISINIAVGSTKFTAKLYDNETTQALVAQFPMTIKMDELNGQEKCYYLSENLPAASTQRPATIHAGDIMLWSGNCLVLFYKTYSNSYGGYVPLGTVDDPSNLASALGSGNVQVTWSLAD